MVERRLHLAEGNGEVPRGDHRVEQVANDLLQPGKARARLLVPVGRKIGKREALGEGHQRARQFEHALVEALGMQGRVVMKMRQRRESGTGGMQ